MRGWRYGVLGGSGTGLLTLWACASFGTTETPANADAASADGGPDASMPDTANGDGAVGSFVCPEGGVSFRDDFNRSDAVGTGWSGLIQGSPTLTLFQNTLRGASDASTDGGNHSTSIAKTQNQLTAKSACASVKLKVVKPTSNAGYNGGRTQLVWLTAVAPNGSKEHYWGLSIDQRGPYLYAATDVEQGAFPAAFTSPLAFELLRIDVDFRTGNATLSYHGEGTVITDTFAGAGGLPSQIALTLAMSQLNTAPEAEVFFDDAELVIYP